MKIWTVFTSLLLFLLVCHGPVFAQDTLFLNNPSFEDVPRHSKVPEGWINCGFKNESPPDVGPTDFFRAKTQASQGQTHLIMVTRDIGTWERIGNLLSSPMQAGFCYTFSLDLAHSPNYLSVSRATDTAVNFNVPVRIRLWGASAQGELQELLAVSEAIKHEDWQQYNFQLCPLETHPMLVLEAMYAAGSEQSYGGNIMLDNCSALVRNKGLTRDEALIQQWNDEIVPSYKARNKSSEAKKELSLVDTILLKQYTADIARGRVDIGLSELAAYAGDFEQLPWIIVLDEEDSPDYKERLRILRKRIRAMGLKAYLRVRLRRPLATDFQWIIEGLGWKG